MTAKKNTELIALDARRFMEIATGVPVVTAYAKIIGQYFAVNDHQASDVMTSASTRDELESIVNQAESASVSRRSLWACLGFDRPRLTLESKYMISARFNSQEMVHNCKDLKLALTELGFTNVLLVDAAGGDQFGPMTMQYLTECDAMIGMISDDYAEKTSSPYCSYYELKHYIENRYGCGTSQILKFYPIKLCQNWPPTSRGAEGAALCSLAFTQDLVWTVDLYQQAFDAKRVAEAFATTLQGVVAEDSEEAENEETLAEDGKGTADEVEFVET